MKRIFAYFLLFSLLLLSVIVSIAQYQDTGVRAESQDTVNLRAYPGLETDVLGQMQVGIQYIVLGRHAQFPWLLLGDSVSLQAIGWVFQDIVLITGDLNTVPFVDVSISNTAPTATIVPIQVTQAATTAITQETSTALPISTQAFTVAGTAQGEINLRYGPGTQYPRVGVAQEDERFQITGYHTQFPWIQIRYDASPTGFAWVAIDLLVTEGDIFSTNRISTTIFNQPTLTPTPAVIQSSAGGLSDAGVPVSPELAALGNQLFSLALNLDFDPETSQFGSLFILDLQTGEAITYGNNVAYSGTSVNKISILATLYGILDGPPSPGLATDIANTMICSENSATNRLIAFIGGGDEWLGAERVTSFMRLIGLENSFLLAPYIIDEENPSIPPEPIPIPETNVNQQIAFPEPYNQLTVSDMGWLLASIYECAYHDSGPLLENFPEGTYEPRECRQILHVMSNNTVDSLLKSGVPEDTRVAHKHGWTDPTHTNAAIFFTPGGDYIVTMALQSNRLDATGNRYLSFSQTLPLFAETSRQIYNYYNPDVPMPAIRESFIPLPSACNYDGSTLVGDIMQPVWDK
jgi:uncharacterized protein YraI